VIRTLLVLGCLIFFGLCLLAMWTGWKHRGGRQSALAARPIAPSELGLPKMAPMTGLYVGTTTADNWQDRVVVEGLGVRASCTATLTDAGLLIDRVGAEPIFIPAASLVSSGLGSGLAGKVMGPGGLLVIRWTLGGVALDTGLRGDDKSVYPAWVNELDEMVRNRMGEAA
jgi:hypothetical protein